MTHAATSEAAVEVVAATSEDVAPLLRTSADRALPAARQILRHDRRPNRRRAVGSAEPVEAQDGRELAHARADSARVPREDAAHGARVRCAGRRPSRRAALVPAGARRRSAGATGRRRRGADPARARALRSRENAGVPRDRATRDPRLLRTARIRGHRGAAAAGRRPPVWRMWREPNDEQERA
jgi:hypothetical protein